RESISERKSNHAGRLHFHHFGGADVTTDDAHAAVVNKDAFADGVECFLPNFLSPPSALFTGAQRIFGAFTLGNIPRDALYSNWLAVLHDQMAADFERQHSCVL